MVRGHQFNKIEMFIFCEPKDSWQMFDELVKNAQALVEGLGLHYQLSKLAAGDCAVRLWPRLMIWKSGCRAWEYIKK